MYAYRWGNSRCVANGLKNSCVNLLAVLVVDWIPPKLHISLSIIFTNTFTTVAIGIKCVGHPACWADHCWSQRRGLAFSMAGWSNRLPHTPACPHCGLVSVTKSTLLQTVESCHSNSFWRMWVGNFLFYKVCIWYKLSKGTFIMYSFICLFQARLICNKLKELESINNIYKTGPLGWKKGKFCYVRTSGPLAMSSRWISFHKGDS